MGTGRRAIRRAKLVTAAAVVSAPLLIVTPVGAAAGPGAGRVRPPDQGLRSTAVSALAPTDSPYVVTSFSCIPYGKRHVVRSPFVTLYAYGADGGGNGWGAEGGQGSVAVASYELPTGAMLIGIGGCNGEAALPDVRQQAHGGHAGASDPAYGGWGGDGGLGTGVGESGGGGGGYSRWSLEPDPYSRSIELMYAGAGGGAGGRNGGGAGGDGDHDGQNASSGGAQRGRAGSYEHGPGAGGIPDARGHLHAGGDGSWGEKGHRVGGGGGGAGYGGGGGGDNGYHDVRPGAGGGGGGSVVFADAGYWATSDGVGHGHGLDGLAQVVRVRNVVRRPSWPGADIVRGVAPNGRRGGGYVLDAFGGIHTFSQGVNPPVPHGGPSWPGLDVARGIATLPDGSGGYIVDLHGQLHPFSLGNHAAPPSVTHRVLWPGRDFARGVTILPDGTGGYVLARNGRLYPFAIGANPKPPAVTDGPSWPGVDAARGVTAPFEDAGRVGGGWIVDVFGGLHPWGRLLGGPTPQAVGSPLPARGVASFAGGAGGVLVDGAGRLRPFASPGIP